MISLYIDADGCPVVEEAIAIAHSFAMDVVIVCDYAHAFAPRDRGQVCLCDQGKDSVDFHILKQVQRGDIVITQDYGLASLLLTKGVHIISQNGLIYHHENMDELLAQRHMHAQLRKAKKHAPHMKKRTIQDDKLFEEAFLNLCKEIVHE